MTEPRQDQTIDPPTDPQLARLYREHAHAEPSAAIDQHILAAARQTATHPQVTRKSGWWQRWRMPLTLVTTVMLTATLALLVERQPPEQPSVSPPENVRERTAQPTDREAETAAPARQLQEKTARPVPAGAPQARGGSSERDRPQAAHSAADQAASPPPAATRAESAPSPASTASEAATRGELRAAPAAAAVPPAATPLAKSRADSTRSPGVWLDEIRALRSAGKAAEADRQLNAFRFAHPDYPLPEEFRQ